jgi:Tfp pilus assembly protein PilF|tara:strand:- start:340914 stop:342215 length:1302 start_codon:yes stop_codon:yes gene_type:complete
MNINKLFLSCAVVSLVSVTALSANSQVYAQVNDDFLAPPVVENVTEIDMGDTDLSLPDDVASESIDFDLSEIASPEATSASVTALDAADADIGEPDLLAGTADTVGAVDIDGMPDFPDVGGGNIVSAPPVNAPAPILNLGDEAYDAVQVDVVVPAQSSNALPSIPVPVAQKIVKPVVSPEVIKTVVGESKGKVEAANDYSPEEKYYSSDRGVTTSDLSTPSKADPIKDPAQKVIIVDRLGSSGGVDSRFVSAQRALDLRRYGAALHMFEGLYRQNPRDQRIVMGRAVALQMTGNEEKAIQAYEELLDLAPKNPKVLVNLLGLIAKQYPAVALERLKELYEKNPGNAAIAAQMGLAEAGLHNYESAERYVGIATSIEPDNAKHYYNLAVIYDRNRAYKKAIGHYERALEIDSMARGGQIQREVIYDRLSRLRGM